MLRATVGQTSRSGAYSCSQGGTLALRGDVPDGMTIDPATGVVRFAPTQAGSGSVEVVCFNGCGATANAATSQAAVTLDYEATACSWLTESGPLTGAPVVEAPDAGLGYLESGISARSGAKITRISDAAAWGLGPEFQWFKLPYTKRPAFNADSSLIQAMAWNRSEGGIGQWVLLDGEDYSIVRHLNPGNGWRPSNRLHRNNPDLIRVIGSAPRIDEYSISADAIVNTTGNFPGYTASDSAFGMGEGQESYDGNRTSIMLTRNDGQTGVGVYDWTVGSIIQFIPVNPAHINWHGMSPSGSHVLMNTSTAGLAGPVGMNSWSVATGTLSASWTDGTTGTRHSTVAVDANGNDVVVMVGGGSGSSQFVQQMFSWRVDNGATELQYAGPVSGNFWLTDAYKAPGHVLLSTAAAGWAGYHDDPTWNQLVRIPLDGSNTGAVIANTGHPDVDVDYNEQTHAMWDNDMSRVLYTSPQDLTAQTTPSHLYVAECA